MANFNKVILVGNLTRDPELKFTQGNTAICSWGMAVNRKWKDQSGADKEEVCFVDVTAFGRTAEVVNQYVQKGGQLLVEGRLKLDQWQDRQTGQNRSKLGVIAESIQLMGQRPTGQRQDDREPPARAQRQPAGPMPPEPPADADDEAPF